MAEPVSEVEEFSPLRRFALPLEFKEGALINNMVSGLEGPAPAFDVVRQFEAKPIRPNGRMVRNCAHKTRNMSGRGHASRPEPSPLIKVSRL